MIKYTPKPLTKYPWVSISRCPNLASQGQHFGRRNPFSRSSMLALCEFRIKWHNSIQIRSKIFRIFSKFAQTLVAIRERANFRSFEFECIIRIYSDFASLPHVRKITRCFEVSRKWVPPTEMLPL